MSQLKDSFGREITYLRLSVTDRCDFRCVYCMAEDMTFLPKAQVLTLEESAEIGRAFAELGVTKIRLTGGEPLVRNGIEHLLAELGEIGTLKELTLTTNGSQLHRYANSLYRNGVRRINVSLDTLDPVQFTELTRFGKLDTVLDGIQAAKDAGIEKIKLNAVILKNRNFNQVMPLVEFAIDNQLDISFIEEMPLGAVVEHGRQEEFCSSADIRALIEEHIALTPSSINTGGPSRYWSVDSDKSKNSLPKNGGSKIGFISPHSDNFCGDCNRVRVTAEGKLLLCLGNEHSLDLKAIIRAHPGDRDILKSEIISAMTRKPERHHFYEDSAPEIVRFMNATGG